MLDYYQLNYLIFIKPGLFMNVTLSSYLFLKLFCEICEICGSFIQGPRRES
jgi:hypothetical protein